MDNQNYQGKEIIQNEIYHNGMYPPYSQPPVYYGETEEQKQKRAEVFKMMALPTVIYAFLYTFCLYKNSNSIMTPVFVLVTLWYCKTVLAKEQQKLKPFSIFCIAGMLLLAVSAACTGSAPLIFMNLAGIFLLLVCTLLFQCCSTENWTIAKGFSAIVTAICGAIGCIGEPFSDFSCFQKKRVRKKDSRAGYIFLGVLFAIPVLLIIVALLYCADAVFADMLRSVFDFDIGVSGVVPAGMMFCYALFASYCGIRYLEKGTISSESKDYRKFEPVVANTILVLVSAVYLAFSAIQILYLFWGNMQLPDGYTYAEYAREGFFQLLFVCMINVGLVLFFMGCFRENRLKKILLTVISLCTYIMLASSALRMCMYIGNYNLTFLRVLVLWLLGLTGILLAGILLQIYKDKFPLFRYTIVTVTVFVLGFTFSHPDYWIAKYNTARQDYSYIGHLSADAAPALDGCTAEEMKPYINRVNDHADEMTFRTFNFSYAVAEKVMDNIQK